MILHPGILALLLGGLVSLVMLAAGGVLGVRIARRWNPALADDRQLALERQSWLVATLVQWAVIFEALSLPLYLFTVDALHPLFVGAMCATGTLNANPLGWHVLWVKLLLLLAGSLWLVVHHLDLRVPATPLTRPKFLALLFLLPLVMADLVLMAAYFSGLHPEIITSCCGALFSSGGRGVAADLAALPVRPMIVAFYATSAGYGLLLLICLWRTGRWWRRLLAAAALGFAAVALASVVAFISVYYYRLPTHHCPFDLLQGHYHYIGYPLYVCLFGAVLCGLVPQLLAMLGRFPVLVPLLPGVERRWITAGLLMLSGLLGLVSWPLLFGEFTLQAYF